MKELSKSKNDVAKLRTELGKKDQCIYDISNDKKILAKQLKEANNTLEDVLKKYKAVCLNLRSYVDQQTTENRSEHLSTLLDLSSKRDNEQPYICTQNNSENDEVLIGPDTPVNNSESLGKSLQDIADKFMNAKKNPNTESISTEIFVKTYTIPSNTNNHDKCDAKIGSYVNLIAVKVNEIDELKTLVKTLLLKSISAIKDAREAIEVILNFFKILETMKNNEIYDYIDHLKKSIPNQKQEFLSKLESLKNQIKYIYDLNCRQTDNTHLA